MIYKTAAKGGARIDPQKLVGPKNVLKGNYNLTGPLNADTVLSENLGWYSIEFFGDLKAPEKFMTTITNIIQTDPGLGIYNISIVSGRQCFLFLEQNDRVRAYLNSELAHPAYYTKDTNTAVFKGPKRISEESLLAYGPMSKDLEERFSLKRRSIKKCFEDAVTNDGKADISTANDALKVINEEQLKIIEYMNFVVDDMKTEQKSESDISWIFRVSVCYLYGLISQEYINSLQGKILDTSNIDILGKVTKETFYNEIENLQNYPQILKSEVIETFNSLVDQEIDKFIHGKTKEKPKNIEEQQGTDKTYFDWLSDFERKNKLKDKNSSENYIIIRYGSNGQDIIGNTGEGKEISLNESVSGAPWENQTLLEEEENLPQEVEVPGATVEKIPEQPKNKTYRIAFGVGGLVKLYVQFEYDGKQKEFSFVPEDRSGSHSTPGFYLNDIISEKGLSTILDLMDEESKKYVETAPFINTSPLEDQYKFEFSDDIYTDYSSEDLSSIKNLMFKKRKNRFIYTIYSIDENAFKQYFSYDEILKRRHSKRINQ